MQHRKLWLCFGFLLLLVGAALLLWARQDRIRAETNHRAFLEWCQFVAPLTGLELSATGEPTVTPHNLALLARLLTTVQKRMDVCAQNLANLDTIVDANGKNNPYRRKFCQITRDGGCVVEEDNTTELCQRYDPASSLANRNGYVFYPNVEPRLEAVEYLVHGHYRAGLIQWLRLHQPSFVEPPFQEDPVVRASIDRLFPSRLQLWCSSIQFRWQIARWNNLWHGRSPWASDPDGAVLTNEILEALKRAESLPVTPDSASPNTSGK